MKISPPEAKSEYLLAWFVAFPTQSILDLWSDDVEHLEDYQSAYAYACVIRFNTAPYTIPERGCAIFFHCSKGATGGCIGLPEADMVNTLLWLDPQENPYILITGYQRSAGN